MMDMKRRTFMQLLAAGVGSFMLDPERLLWVPGAKTIFIPPEKTVDVYTTEDMDFLLKLNQYTFAALYTDPQDVLRDSERLKVNPFDLYARRNWGKKYL